MDLIGLAMGFAEIYAVTDANNADVGGAQPALAYFDGDPFPADNGVADGQATLHDRALAMMRVALVNLDRLHTDPASGLLVDSVTMSGATPTRGTTVSTTSVAYTLLGLRTVLRTCSSQLELYSNNTPDTAIGTTPLDALADRIPERRVADVHRPRSVRSLQSEAELCSTTTSPTRPASAYAGWDVSQNAPTDTSDSLDAHTAAIRGLFAAYLATGDVKYETRAIAVFDRMQATFYDPIARIYGATPAPVDRRRVSRRCASRCSRARCATCTSSSRSGPVAKRASLCSRSSSPASTSCSSTAGTIATAIASSTGPPSA